MDGQYDNHQYPQYRPTSGNAIAALVLGILSLIIPYIGLVLGIIGIVLARKALREIQQQNLNGKGMAVAGLTTSIIGCAIYGFIIVVFTILGGIAASFSTY
ncbi:DUF4190 domain-containing protein [Caldibacillus lycopersici]|uniref:DUF4190 domain-containing protein n=1 Tax=Perspicuibacillus lycopersici TaxID=1325689 RepID=A0AAE3IRB9_9BACI|nr:DUF4190 domain-containing protein [Perspicuibacillus lycopersici]MCU9613163.1 DUF4190 domain-containing protein [Perspicuibacillus lycopersici]